VKSHHFLILSQNGETEGDRTLDITTYGHLGVLKHISVFLCRSHYNTHTDTWLKVFSTKLVYFFCEQTNVVYEEAN
jgi:hypothetical protein